MKKKIKPPSKKRAKAKKPRSAKQRAATKRMLAAAKKARSKKRSPKRAATNAREWVSSKIRLLMKEGYTQKRAVAAALAMARKKGLKVGKKNPFSVTTVVEHHHDKHGCGGRKKNPLLGTLTGIGNPRGKKRKAKKQAKRSNPIGRQIRFCDLSPAMQREARPAAKFAADLAGVPLNEMIGEFCDAPAGTAKHVPVVGELESLAYKAQPKSARAYTRDGQRILWDHKAGDHGRGQPKSTPQLVCRDMRTGKPLLVSRRGSRAGVSSRRGLLG